MPGCRPDQLRERRLARLDCIAPKIAAVQRKKIERVEKHAGIVPTMPDPLEYSQPTVIAGDGLSID